MNKPLVSVITATFNLVNAGRTQFFQKCIDSVASQTYEHIEHIIVDGASNDGTSDIIEACAREKAGLRLICEPDDGIFYAMNKGARAASGKYIAFLNSDDFWHDEKAVELSVEALEKDHSVFSYAPSFVLDREFPVQKVFTSIGSFFMRMPFCHQTMFVRRDAFMEFGMFDEENFRSAADFNFIQKLCAAGCKFSFIPQCFTSYRHGGFSAVDTKTSEIECLRSIFAMFRSLDSSFTPEDADALFYRKLIREDNYNSLLVRVAPELRHCMDELGREKVGSAFLKIQDYEYSYPLAWQDAPPQWLKERVTLSINGWSFATKSTYSDRVEISLFDPPV
jgi:glycosyltransferase involved in cell wall biosynthesis